MLPYIVIFCVLFTIVFLAVAIALWSKQEDSNGTPEKKTSNKPKDWQGLIVPVICVVLLAVAALVWVPSLFWAIVNKGTILWILLAIATFVLVFVFLREPADSKKPSGPKKISTAGWAVLICVGILIAPVFIAGRDGSNKSPWSVAKKTIASHNPFGDAPPPERNDELEGIIRGFWQEKLATDPIGLQKMLAVAELSGFNQFDGKQVFVREVGTRRKRYKIGVMGIDQSLWSWAGTSTGLNIRTSVGENLAGAWYLYQKYGTLPWDDNIVGRIRQGSEIIKIPVGEWTDWIDFRQNSHGEFSGDVVIVTEAGKKYEDGPGKHTTMDPPAKKIRVTSASGRPEVMLLN